MGSMQKFRPMTIMTPLKGVDHDRLFVRTFRGRERLGRLFEYEVEFHTDQVALSFEEMLGGNVTVSIARTDLPEDSEAEPRHFNGYVSRFEQIGWEGRRMVYRATLVPWLWFMTRAVDCRVHAPRESNRMRMPKLIKDLISEQKLGEVEDRLRGAYREHEFSVQYNESYHDYFMRIMEREGFYGFFVHRNGAHSLVLADDPGAHEVYEGADGIELRPEGHGKDTLGYVRTWLPMREVRSGKYSMRDYNYLRPRDATETHSKEKSGPLKHENDRLEVYEYPGGYAVEGEAREYVRVRLEDHQSTYSVCSGESDHRGIAVGYRFNLVLPNDVQDTYKDPQGGAYLVIEAQYEAHNPEAESGGYAPAGPAFQCRFRAIPAETPFRLARETPRPVVRGPQTAVVVGRSGDEVHSDSLARVRVQFHWDRDGAFNEKSSIWVRVGQTMAGRGWGHQFTPRVGHEVIVSFLEGDPDRPLVTGCVYNQDNPPPYDQGEYPTFSTIKTNSSKGGGGFNELRFDDKKGEEQIFLHAQKNYDQRVLNDRYEWIGNDRHLIVKHDKFEHVENDRHETIGRHHHEEIGKDRHVRVKGKEAIQVDGSHSETVGDDVIEVYKKNQSTEITKDLYVKADNICIEAMTNITIKVGESHIAIEKGGIKIGTTGNIKLEATGNIDSASTGNTTVKSTGMMTVEGTAPTTVKSAAILTVQGSVVKIN